MKQLITLFSFLLALASTAQDVKWLTFEEAIALNEKEPKKIFIDVYTDWCGWCKRMDKNTFQHPAVAALLNEHYYAVKLDAEGSDTIHFANRDFVFVPQGRKGYHQLAAALLQGKMSYPTVVFLNENMEIIQPLPGYQSPEDFEPILVYFATDSHTKMPFEDFRQQYAQKP